jgi:hypothetical protein
MVFDDGIVAVGDHHVRPGYWVGTKQDEGRLGATVAKIRNLARTLERMLERRRHPRRPSHQVWIA